MSEKFIKIYLYVKNNNNNCNYKLVPICNCINTGVLVRKKWYIQQQYMVSQSVISLSLGMNHRQVDLMILVTAQTSYTLIICSVDSGPWQQ